MENDGDSFACEQCRHIIPSSNRAIHAVRCSAISRKSPILTITPNASSTRNVGMIDLTSPATPAPTVDLTDSQNTENGEDMDRTSSHDRKSIVDLTDVSPLQQTSPSPPPPPPAGAFTGRAQPMERRRGGGGEATAMDVQIQGIGDEDIGMVEGWDCPSCTFRNAMGDEICGMCLSSVVEEQALLNGTGGRRERSSGGSSSSSSGSSTWLCPLCTFENSVNLPGPLICQACETGRPTTRDRERLGLSCVGGDGGGRGGSSRAGFGRSTFENIVNGAFIGAIGAGVTTAFRGGSPADHRRRMMQGMLMGGIGGGMLGQQVRELMALDQNIDNMSYEEMLNLFGPGHVPEKANPQAVEALPESKVTESDLQRMRRDSTGDAKDCCICMEEFTANDIVKRLPCSHAFHKKCIEQWLLQHNNNCPICKMAVGFGGGGGGGAGGGRG